jgi:hypothetical protein
MDEFAPLDAFRTGRLATGRGMQQVIAGLPASTWSLVREDAGVRARQTTHRRVMKVYPDGWRA